MSEHLNNDQAVGVPGWQPAWPVPANVLTWVTERGVGKGVYGTCNLAFHVGDEPAKVRNCRARLQRQCDGLPLQWLSQVHGTQVVRLGHDAAQVSGAGPVPEADALYTRCRG